MAVVAAGVSQNGREYPESGGSPGGNRNAKGDYGGDEKDDDKHRGTIAGSRVIRVDEVQLQIERWGEKCLQLLREWRAGGAEAQWC